MFRVVWVLNELNACLSRLCSVVTVVDCVVLQQKPAPDARVLKQRDYEDKLYSMQQGVQVKVTLHCTAACFVQQHTKAISTPMTEVSTTLSSLARQHRSFHTGAA